MGGDEGERDGDGELESAMVGDGMETAVELLIVERTIDKEAILRCWSDLLHRQDVP